MILRKAHICFKKHGLCYREKGKARHVLPLKKVKTKTVLPGFGFFIHFSVANFFWLLFLFFSCFLFSSGFHFCEKKFLKTYYHGRRSRNLTMKTIMYLKFWTDGSSDFFNKRIYGGKNSQLRQRGRTCCAQPVSPWKGEEQPLQR